MGQCSEITCFDSQGILMLECTRKDFDDLFFFTNIKKLMIGSINF
jgi:hypothetical protein